MAEEIDAIWERAHRWLDSNASDARTWLAPPADPIAIANAEQAIGLSFPDDFRASLAIHDGQVTYTAPLFAGLRLLQLDEIVRDWRINERIAAGAGAVAARGLPEGVVRPVWLSRAWIPIASDEEGNAAVVDLDPGPRGTSGQILFYFTQHPDRPRVARSFTQFLSDRVSEWERGIEIPERDPDGYFEGFLPIDRAWSAR